MTQPDISTLSYLDPKVAELLPEIVENLPTNVNVADQLAYYAQKREAAKEGIDRPSGFFKTLACVAVFWGGINLYTMGEHAAKGEDQNYRDLASSALYFVAAGAIRQFEKVAAKRRYLAAHYLHTEERKLCSPVVASILNPTGSPWSRLDMPLNLGLAQEDIMTMPDSLFRFWPREVEALGDFRNQILSLKPPKKAVKNVFST